MFPIKKKVSLIAITAGVFLAVFFLWQMMPEEKVDFEGLGLGIDTTESFDENSMGRSHCIDMTNVDECLSTVEKTASPQQFLWLGASQLHSINDQKQGDRTAPSLVHEILNLNGIALTTLSQPNANYQEHLVLFEFMRTKMKVNGLIIAAVYDDMREPGVRSTVSSAVNYPDVAVQLQKSMIGRSIVTRNSSAQELSNQTAEDQKSLQSYVEEKLDAWLADHFGLWKARPQLRGRLVVALRGLRRRVLILRNKIMGINSTKWFVSVSDAQYGVNYDALSQILMSAQADEIPVLLYVAPRPIDAYFPYDLTAYGKFKTQVEKLASTHQAHFVNMEDAVKGDVWGTIDNGVGEIVTDVFHFQAAGHRQMSAGIMKALEQYDYIGWATR